MPFRRIRSRHSGAGNAAPGQFTSDPAGHKDPLDDMKKVGNCISYILSKALIFVKLHFESCMRSTRRTCYDLRSFL